MATFPAHHASNPEKTIEQGLFGERTLLEEGQLRKVENRETKVEHRLAPDPSTFYVVRSHEVLVHVIYHPNLAVPLHQSDA
jgi:hypothetical protein